MNKRIAKTLVYLLFLQTLLFQVDIPEVILCFGDDGHISLENTNFNNCEHDTNLTLFPILKENNNKEIHNTCVDINLDLHFSNPNIQKNRSFITVDQSIFYLTLYTNPACQYSRFISKYNLTLHNQSTEKISNTVLLI